MTQLAGAVIATGSIQVQSNRQIVQHAEGGVVGKILVRDGDFVEAGQALIHFDDTLSRSELSIIEGQLVEFSARAARLAAERDGVVDVSFAEVFNPDTSDGLVAKNTEGQRRLFLARTETLAQKTEQLQEQITQLEHEVEGTEAQLMSLRTPN